MLFLYNIGIRLYGLAIFIASFFHEKARLFRKGRKHFFQTHKSVYTETYIWVHASSLGEFEQGRPIIEKIKAEYPNQKILLSFFSPSGYEIRKNYQLADKIVYLPLDTAKNARKFIELFNPKALILVKYEFWYHYLNELSKKNIPILSVSSIFRENQIHFKPHGSWFLKMLQKVDYFFVQNKSSLDILQKNNIFQATQCGDTRFDRVKQIAEAAPENTIIKQFKDKSKIIIAGSTWPPDEDILAEIINTQQLDTKWIIAPHEIGEKHIIQLQQKLKVPTVLYSNLNKTVSLGKDSIVLIINNIGLLASAYKYGDIAYIGGGFGVGIHNILEPATFGLPIFFGPKYQKFQEAIDLVELQGAASISDSEKLYEHLNTLLNNNELYQKKKNTIKNYVAENTGATELIFQYLIENKIVNNAILKS